MKTLVRALSLFGLTILAVMAAYSQIPNAGFENWANGAPMGWSTTNTVAGTPFTQTTDAHSGSSALQGTTITVLSVAVAPAAYADFPLTGRYAALTGWYKFSPVGGDSLKIHSIVFKGTTPLGYSIFTAGAAKTTYTQFTSPMNYISADIPDNAYLEFSLESPNDNPNVGSSFKLDDLSFTGSTGVQESGTSLPGVFRLNQNYPNPFNPVTTVTFTLARDGDALLQVFDMLGREVRVIRHNGLKAGTLHAIVLDASDLPTGAYTYRLTSGGQAAMKRLLLVK